MKIVAYYRVSTQKQGISGLGMEAQRTAVLEYSRTHRGEIVATFIERESGKRSDRPELAKAIARARAIRGRLVIAKLDRLARNVAFTSTLLDSGLDFAAVDMPDANRTTIQLMAVFAEHEARCISERTKAALAAAKKRGIRLGTHRRNHFIDHRKGTRNGLSKAQAAAAANRQQARRDCYSHLIDDIQSWRNDHSYAAIAAKLNDRGEVTTSGKAFAPMTVQRIIEQLAAK